MIVNYIDISETLVDCADKGLGFVVTELKIAQVVPTVITEIKIAQIASSPIPSSTVSGPCECDENCQECGSECHRGEGSCKGCDETCGECGENSDECGNNCDCSGATDLLDAETCQCCKGVCEHEDTCVSEDTEAGSELEHDNETDEDGAGRAEGIQSAASNCSSGFRPLSAHSRGPAKELHLVCNFLTKQRCSFPLLKENDLVKVSQPNAQNTRITEESLNEKESSSCRSTEVTSPTVSIMTTICEEEEVKRVEMSMSCKPITEDARKKIYQKG